MIYDLGIADNCSINNKDGKPIYTIKIPKNPYNSHPPEFDDFCCNLEECVYKIDGKLGIYCNYLKLKEMGL